MGLFYLHWLNGTSFNTCHSLQPMPFTLHHSFLQICTALELATCRYQIKNRASAREHSPIAAVNLEIHIWLSQLSKNGQVSTSNGLQEGRAKVTFKTVTSYPCKSDTRHTIPSKRAFEKEEL